MSGIHTGITTEAPITEETFKGRCFQKEFKKKQKEQSYLSAIHHLKPGQK